MKPTDILCWGLDDLGRGQCREVVLLKPRTKQEQPRVLLGVAMQRSDYDRMMPWERRGQRLPRNLNVELDLFLQEVEKRVEAEAGRADQQILDVA